MSDNLRDRIAAALDQHKTDPYDEWTCQCSNSGTRWADHLADAVIRELGLKHSCRECGGWGPMDD